MSKTEITLAYITLTDLRESLLHLSRQVEEALARLDSLEQVLLDKPLAPAVGQQFVADEIAGTIPLSEAEIHEVLSLPEGISALVTTDADFDRVAYIKVFKPVPLP